MAGKKLRQARTLIEEGRIYTLEEAVDLLDRTNTVKFDPTVEIHLALAIDPTQADQLIRSTITLPHGSGKKLRIGAFTESGNEKTLIAAGANVAGGDDLIDKVMANDIEFDVAIATPTMMRKMAKVAKVLGPKGLMPNPKAGTVGENLENIVKELVAGKFEFKNDKQGGVHSIVGKLSFGPQKLSENVRHFIKTMKEVKPSGLKSGAMYIKSVSLATAMGPGIRISID